jgi:hypothetical protein
MKRRLLVRRGLAAVFALLAVPAFAQDAAPSAYTVKGFRSAHFGMTKAQVKAAIAKDFHLKSDRIQDSIVAEGRTPVLVIHVPALFPESGAGDVAYLFGYHSARLMQITVTLSTQTDASLSRERIVVDGQILQHYFLGAGYPPKQVVVNQGTQIGVVLFQGTDPLGHLTNLVLRGQMSKGSDGKMVLDPQALQINYVADPQHPDVMKSLAGQF